MQVLDYGNATVTSKGVSFKEIYYSSSQAIELQWFEKAHIKGSWNIPVMFNPENLEIIYFDDQIGELVECRAINIKEFEKSKLEKYFKSIQYLKKIRQSRKPSSQIKVLLQKNIHIPYAVLK